MEKLELITIELDPTWTVARRFPCGHVQHACHLPCLDDVCPVCEPQAILIGGAVYEGEEGL